MAFHSRATFEKWLPALFDGAFDWDFLKPAFTPTRIEPMDFDAVIERRGHFLIFETKKPGKRIDTGQAITLTRQWQQDKTTILVLSGKNPKEIEGFALYAETQNPKPGQVGDKPLIRGDAFDVLYRVRCWFCWVNNHLIPTRDQWDRQLWLWDYDRNNDVPPKDKDSSEEAA